MERNHVVLCLGLWLGLSGLAVGESQARMSDGQVGVIAPKADVTLIRATFADALNAVPLETTETATDYRDALLIDWDEQYWHLQNQLQGEEPLPGTPEQTFNPHALVYQADRHPLGVMLRRTNALLEQLASSLEPELLTAFRQDWVILQEAAGAIEAGEAEYALFLAAAALQRELALQNPLLDFDELLFVARGVYNGSRAQGLQSTTDDQGQHFATQYFGFNAIPGGGLYVASGIWDNDTPALRDVLEDSVVESGRLTGQTLEPGAFLSPDLSYDGTEILFAYTENQEHVWEWNEHSVFHIFKVNVDGTGLQQLTDGVWNDFDPTYLPNGRIAFISERRGGYIRCFSGLEVPNHVLHSMKPDGSDVYPLSYFETSEWHPSVNNDGMLVYTRWDYVDRENCLGGNFWIKYPDGRNPRAPHGNYPQPWHTLGEEFPRFGLDTERYPEVLASLEAFPMAASQFQQEVHGPAETPTLDGRLGRPYTEMSIRAIPNSHRYIATAAPHHGEAFGSLVILDLQVPDDGFMSQVRRITPYVLFPESEQGARLQYPYGTAWPLSEDFYLVNRWENVYLLDSMGNHILLVENSAAFDGETNWDMRLISPIPLKTRTMPPAIPTLTNKGEDRNPEAPPATISVMNVYDTDLPYPEGAEIKYIRILQNILKSNPEMDQPRNMGYHWENTPRIPLGIVPVEEDGSAYFEAPVERELIFQVLDDNRMAVQSMRSVAYVHPGEKLSCVGCHEDPLSAPSYTSAPLALQRPPSRLEPEVSDPVEPVTFYRLVQPVFEQRCITCHRDEGVEPLDMSYFALQPYIANFSGGMRSEIMIPDSGGSRSIPGQRGAMGSRMGQALLDDNHRDVVSEEDFNRIVLWLDANAMRLGAFHSQEAQMAGEVVWPLLDIEPENPQGLEHPRPSSGERPLEGPFGQALQTPVQGLFGAALDANYYGMLLENPASYRQLPITVEVWARMYNHDQFNILVASDTKNSAAHWELYTEAGTGNLSVYLPGRGGVVNSGAPVCDDTWRHLGMILEEDRVRLYVDGVEVADQALSPLAGEVQAGGFAIGQLVEGTLGCHGYIDQVRLSSGLQAISEDSVGEMAPNDATLGFWDF